MASSRRTLSFGTTKLNPAKALRSHEHGAFFGPLVRKNLCESSLFVSALLLVRMMAWKLNSLPSDGTVWSHFFGECSRLILGKPIDAVVR
jgi:hypothetical protein